MLLNSVHEHYCNKHCSPSVSTVSVKFYQEKSSLFVLFFKISSRVSYITGLEKRKDTEAANACKFKTNGSIDSQFEIATLSCGKKILTSSEMCFERCYTQVSIVTQRRRRIKKSSWSFFNDEEKCVSSNVTTFDIDMSQSILGIPLFRGSDGSNTR